jgi:MFS family permease
MPLAVDTLIALMHEFLQSMLSRGDGAILTGQGASAAQGLPNMRGPGPAQAAQRNYLQSLGGRRAARPCRLAGDAARVGVHSCGRHAHAGHSAPAAVGCDRATGAAERRRPSSRPSSVPASLFKTAGHLWLMLGDVVSHVRLVATGSPRSPMLAVLLTGQVMVSMDGSIVSVAAQTIRVGLHASGAEIQFLLSSYLLTTGVLLVTCARIGDVIGYRRAFLIGLVWFTGASLLCGLALDPTMLVLARVAQAVGAAMLMPQVFSLIHRHWEGAERRTAIGVYSMVLALGVALGQLIGGLVAGVDLFGLSWRPVFLINVPIGVIVLVIGWRVLPSSPTDEQPRLDLAGVALLTASMTALTVPLIVGHGRGWPAWTWIVLACGAVLLGVFARYESTARHPVFDLAALKPNGVKLGLAACCIVMGCYTVFVLTLTLHLQSELGYTPLQAGLAFVPYALGFGALSVSWNHCPQWLQRVMPIVGPLVFAVGVALVVILIRDHEPPWGFLPLLLFAGAGHAAGYSPMIAQVTSLVEPRLASAISAMNSTGPVLAEVVGVAGLGSVYFAASSSAHGLLLVGVAVAVLLVVATTCAAVATLGRAGTSR